LADDAANSFDFRKKLKGLKKQDTAPSRLKYLHDGMIFPVSEKLLKNPIV